MVAGANAAGHPESLIGKAMGNEVLYDPSGSGTAAPIWSAAMSVVQKWLPNKAFVPPNSHEIKGVELTVPPVGGMDPEAARQRLQKLGLNAVIENDYKVDSDYSYGTVAYTSPGSYSSASSGDTVVIYVSDGTPYVPPAPAPEPQPAPQPQPQPAPQPQPQPKPKPHKPAGGGGGGGAQPPGHGNGNGNGNGGRGPC